MIGIYKITNKINGKCYIGQSINIKRRWRNHKKDAFWKNGPDYEYPLYRAFRKYGVDNFSFEVLELCTQDELNQKEIEYILLYNSCGDGGYNQNEGGSSQIHNQKLSKEDIAAIIHRLKTSFDTLQSIADDYNVGLTTMHYINVGEAYRQENESYPIRKKLSQIRPGAIERKYPKCPKCGAPVNRLGNICRNCVNQSLLEQSKRSMITLSPLEFAKKILDNGFESVGREYDVSGKTIAHWCEKFNIPYRKKELREWYNEQTGIVPTPPKVKQNIEERVRPVKQIDMISGQILNVFANQQEALKYLDKVDKRTNHIGQACRGIRKSAYGYFWQYADTENT